MKFSLFFVLVTFPVSSILGMKCYQCHHPNWSNDQDDFDCQIAADKYLTECTTDTQKTNDFHLKDLRTTNSILLEEATRMIEYSCIESFVFSENGVRFVDRMCVPHEDDKCVEQTIDGETSRRCICNYDGCNQNIIDDDGLTSTTESIDPESPESEPTPLESTSTEPNFTEGSTTEGFTTTAIVATTKSGSNNTIIIFQSALYLLFSQLFLMNNWTANLAHLL